jgi:predicted alpha/beta-hydrolase family hydrolase
MSKPGALLLAPGAGSSSEHPSLRAIEAAVARCPSPAWTSPTARPAEGPDRTPVLLAAVVEEAAALVATAHIRPNRLALGGRSMGGRMCSMAVADGLPAKAARPHLLPAPPAGKPAQLRTEHLPAPHRAVPVHLRHEGPVRHARRARAATATIPGAVTHHWIAGKGHDLKGADAELASTVAGWLRRL